MDRLRRDVEALQEQIYQMVGLSHALYNLLPDPDGLEPCPVTRSAAMKRQG